MSVRTFSLVIILILLVAYSTCAHLPVADIDNAIQSESGETRIVGGTIPRADQFKFVASVQKRNAQHVCAAVIVRQRWLLTSATCMRPFTFLVVVEARVGSHVRNEGGFRTDIMRSLTHEQFEPRSHRNDIALLHLRDPIRWNVRTAPIALPDAADLVVGAAAKFVGWGAQTQLQVLATRIVSNEHCKVKLNSIGLDGYVRLTNICTAGKDGKGSCSGSDLGSPLVGPGDKLVGLLSFVHNKCGSDKPEVFTRVYKYVPWINATIRWQEDRDRN